MSLAGSTVVLSGSFEGYTQAQLGSEIKTNGATYATKITDACTHLVVSEKDFAKPSEKVKSAKDLPKTKIVSIEWLKASFGSGKKVNEKKYLMAEATAAKPEPEDDKPATKKRGRAAKKPAVKEEEESESEEDEEDAETSEPPSKKQKDGQKAKDGMVVPVDEAFPYRGGGYAVYIDKNSTIYDASLNQTNAGNNNNKFYRIQVLYQNSNYLCWTRWGRVGESGQNAKLGDGSQADSIKHFEKKFKDKSGLAWSDRLVAPKKGKYTFLEKSYQEDSEEEGNGKKEEKDVKKVKVERDENDKPVECTLEAPIQELMRLIFNIDNFVAVMAALNYDADKLPLGKLSKNTIKRGYESLKSLAEIIIDPSRAGNTPFRTAVEDLSNSYYTLIPHSFGRNRPPIISDNDLLKREIELLDSLSDMSISDKIMKESKSDVKDLIHPLDKQYTGLGMVEMTALDKTSTEFKELKDYLIKSHGSTHYMKMNLEEIFRIERTGEGERFNKSPYAKKAGDRRMLWHGSRATNFGGILSQGLRIAPPEAPVSGYMFGKGIYLADISSKSAGYTSYHNSGGIGLLLLCEAELGKPMLELTDADYDAAEKAKKNGSFSTWGKGQTVPQGWKDASCVNPALKGIIMPDTTQTPGDSKIDGAYLQYNEFICYDVAQIRLRYLFRVKMT
ncbi:hypothetical protein MMC25_001678 [Agyrium rufum]|nr:hypothetical protein [Agyrium rufum]